MFGASKRDNIKQILPSVVMRRKFWEKFYAVNDVQMASDFKALERVYKSISCEDFQPVHAVTWIEYGEDVELLTLKALQIMQQTEIVLYSPNCPFDFVDLIRRDAERVCYENDSELDNWLIQLERTKKSVVVFCNSERLDILASTTSVHIIGLGRKVVGG